jgi:hypothetical protein
LWIGCWAAERVSCGPVWLACVLRGSLSARITGLGNSIAWDGADSCEHVSSPARGKVEVEVEVEEGGWGGTRIQWVNSVGLPNMVVRLNYLAFVGQSTAMVESLGSEEKERRPTKRPDA